MKPQGVWGNKNLRWFKLDFKFGLRNLISAIDVGREEEWCILSSVGDLVANGIGGHGQEGRLRAPGISHLRVFF